MKMIISEKIMNKIKKLLPRKTRKRGRPTVCPRKAFLGIAYVLTSVIQWAFLPNEYGYPSTVHATV